MIRDYEDPIQFGSLASRADNIRCASEIMVEDTEDIEDRADFMEVVDELEDFMVAKLEKLRIFGMIWGDIEMAEAEAIRSDDNMDVDA